MTKDTRKYYRIGTSQGRNTGITTGIIAINMNPWQFRGYNEDVRLDFTGMNPDSIDIDIQLYEPQDGSPAYWFITRYEFQNAQAYRKFQLYSKVIAEVHAFIAGREMAVKRGEMHHDEQLKLDTIPDFIEVDYPNGYHYMYPVKLAPTPTGHKWIILIDPKDVPGRKKPAATHTMIDPDRNMYHDKPLTYLGFVYADTPEQAQERVRERLVNYERRPDLYEAYVKFNPVPLPKFKAWPGMAALEYKDYPV